jgi:hypothetical protein
VKVKVNVPLLDILPESKDAGPLVEVAVCVAPSLFVQVTESPVSIVRLEGPKANPWMLTAWLALDGLASVTGAKTLRLDMPINNTIQNVNILPLTIIQSHPYF